MRGLLRTLIAGAAVVVAGCSDSATSPSNPATRGAAPADGPSLNYSAQSRFGGYRSTTFTLTAAGGTFNVGGLYTVTIPANAVCVVGSSYGPGTWDSPCATLGAEHSITVTATYGYDNGGPVVDFTPELRFSPGSQVTISTSLYAPVITAAHGFFNSNPDALRHYAIYYVPTLGARVEVDAAIDPTLVTHVNLTTGLVWRRIKHFSGYNVATGLACEVQSDPNCKSAVTVVIDQ